MTMKNQKINIVAIVGKAGAGKDYLLQYLEKSFPELHSIVSATTRPPRQGEKNGVNYYFLTAEEFAKQVLNDNFLEATVFRDWCYGTQLSALDKNKINIGVFNPTGIEILQQDNRVNVYVIKVGAAPKTRLIRQLNREDNPDIDEIIRRYKTDEMDFLEADFKHHYHFSNNDEKNFQESVNDLIPRIKVWAKENNLSI